ncbi:histidine phosphatase family protein [Nocardioides caldifontis]|uniref:histidine phosphatase family protein n=1 Tax=Nocardioides caldifontis TaxID=2588938 RepID=UPI0013969B93|nr:histidine phosphatase family protein [Nocardioides caldifontis]
MTTHPHDRPARRLVLLRHGRTHWNHVRRAQGHADVPLDEVGEAQARAVAPLVAALRPARLWSSDLPRARQTADAVAAASGLHVEEDPRLREFSVGERQGLTWDEAVERFPWTADGVGLGEQLRGVPGAESDEDVAGRVVPAVRELAAVLEPGETGVAVSHGAAIKLALVGLLGWDQAAARTLAVLGNCQWTTVVLPEGRAPKLLDYGVGDFATREGIG